MQKQRLQRPSFSLKRSAVHNLQEIFFTLKKKIFRLLKRNPANEPHNKV